MGQDLGQERKVGGRGPASGASNAVKAYGLAAYQASPGTWNADAGNDYGTNKIEVAGSKFIPPLALKIMNTEPEPIKNEDMELDRKWRALDESMN